MTADQIRALLESGHVADRLEALKAIQENADTLSLDYLELAAQAIGDPNNHCRWQAFIAVGEFIARAPMKVWDVAKAHGVSSDEDMRDATATILLEHLLDHDFDAFFPLVKNEIDSGSPMLLDTLQRCWPFDRSQIRWKEVVEYLVSKGIDPVLPWELGQL